MLSRVGQEVDQYLNYASSVRHNEREIGFQVDVDIVSVSAAQEGVPSLVHESSRFCRFRSHRQHTSIDRARLSSSVIRLRM